MRLSAVKNLGLLVLAVVGIAPCANAGIITAPPGLSPGSQYRLVFVTTDLYTASSTSITVYNNDVNSEANAISALDALGTTWLAIGSTSTVNAIDNVGIDAGIPIYDLEGQLVAADASTAAGGLFSGSLLALIQTDGGEAASNAFIWTGTLPDGQAALGYQLGLSPSPVEVGEPGFLGSAWIASGPSLPDITQLPLYGISGILTVPTPEPSTISMVIAAGALTIFARRRVHRNRRAAPTPC